MDLLESPQRLMQHQPIFFSMPSSVWSNTLLIPVYATLTSALVLLLHIVFLAKPVRKFCARLLPHNLIRSELSFGHDQSPDLQTDGLFAEAREHIAKHGGGVIFGFKLARLFGCMTILCLFIASLIIDETGTIDDELGVLGKWAKKHKHKHGKSHPHRFSANEWLQAAMCITYLYASILALISVSAKPRWSKLVVRHLNVILILTFGVYFYRDVFPLATFTKTPQDLSEGRVLWAKVITLTFTGVIVPLFMPRQYIPVDPKNPMLAPNPEQTASIVSFVLYTFLDPIIFLAYRIPHLPFDELPPLADYDYPNHLKATTFPFLDPFSGGKKRHIFFGLMRVFRREYMILATMLVIQVIASLVSPVGIFRLLRYLETNGEGAEIRPWIWILWLFLGPFVRSLSLQFYIFYTTRTLVRTECIITQLVFEHSLRIRMKAETQDTSATTEASMPITPTPDSASIEEQPSRREEGSGGDETPEPSSVAEAETLNSSSASMKSTTSSKGKQKAKLNEQESSPKEGAAASNLIGKINNLITTDLDNVVAARDFLLILIDVPLQIALSIWFLYFILGWSAFVGLATILLLFPLPGYIASRIQAVQVAKLKKTDARVQAVTETMGVLRMVKLFSWEKKMNERLSEKREEELTWLWKLELLELLNGNLNFVIPVITMIATYSTYLFYLHIVPQTIIMKRNLNASTVFSSMAVFDMLREQLHTTFFMITRIVTGKVSLDRIDDFLQNTELLDSFSRKDDLAERWTNDIHINEDTIGFRNATFGWSNVVDGSLTPSRRKFILRIEDELIFHRGCINLIIGPTGSGKTSMLMALLGEMHFIPSGPSSWFNLPRTHGVAYAAQESWVQNETIKENIVFGAPFDEKRYKKVIYQCCLERDLTLFDAGDQTEVGEKGLTLSGGQKARITLARAIYSHAEIILLDDVLAALDVHTAKWIIEKCFAGDLIQGRTVLLVTHNVGIARPIAGFVVSLGTDGKVLSQGPVSDILARDRTLTEEATQNQEIVDHAEDNIDSSAPQDSTSDGKLIVAEEIEQGHVSWAALKLYLSGLGGNHPFFFFFALVVGLVLTEVSNTVQTWFLGYWGSQYEKSDPSEIAVFYYISVYSALLLFAIIVYSLSFVVYIFGVLRASRTIHRQLVESVLGTTLRWLDITPTSRVIARCTQDIRAVDGPFSSGLRWLSEMTMSMLIKFGAVVLFTPMFFVPGVLVAILGGWCGQIYIAAQLSVRREMSNARSPVLGHFGAAIAGLTSIRAYGAQASFKQESLNRINKYMRAARTFYNLNRWVCIRIDALGGLFAAGLAAYLVYFHPQKAATTGFSLNMAVGFSGMILWWVRVFNDVEVQGNSLERIQGYISIEQEPKPAEGGTPPAYWPASGDIRVENLSARYSRDGPKVLHDISFHIKSGERVGVVGRTGSGKSSLTLALLRCIFTEGSVYYDGIPISSLNLDALRSNITIIPQVPELLSGTLRENLDPFEHYDDGALNDALRSAGLFSLQSEIEDGKLTLDSAISSGGGNLSVGQRQILALARAIVRGSKLLILDEATSAIDFKTDSIIQSSLRHQLSGDVTLITVAHRLQTIMDADKIMVLDAGRIVEFASPKELLNNRDGKLRALVNESEDRDTLCATAGST